MQQSAEQLGQGQLASGHGAEEGYTATLSACQCRKGHGSKFAAEVLYGHVTISCHRCCQRCRNIVHIECVIVLKTHWYVYSSWAVPDHA